MQHEQQAKPGTANGDAEVELRIRSFKDQHLPFQTSKTADWCRIKKRYQKWFITSSHKVRVNQQVSIFRPSLNSYIALQEAPTKRVNITHTESKTHRRA